MNKFLICPALCVLVAASGLAGGLDQSFDATVAEAFGGVHQGFSVDEVLIHRELRTTLVERVRHVHPEATEREINLTLLRLRKAGKISVAATKRGKQPSDLLRSAAEIAARMTVDQTSATTDEMIADPNLRAQLLEAANQVAEGATEYDVLKHVLNLRKARKLKPELVLKVVQWPRDIVALPLEQLAQNLTLAPELPGIYLFRTPNGYLYIGESANLRKRLSEHLDPTKPSPLSAYLAAQSKEPISVEIHAFAKDSPAANVSMRRAYESELIRSRNPRLNVRP